MAKRNPNPYFSKEELMNLKEALHHVIKDLEDSSNNREQFYNTPIKYLRKYNIAILNYISKVPNLARHFVQAVRKLMDELNRIVNKCLRCRLAVLLILYGTLGKVGHSWLLLLAFIDSIKRNLSSFFDSLIFDELFDELFEFTNRVSPNRIARLICKELGYCS